MVQSSGGVSRPPVTAPQSQTSQTDTRSTEDPSGAPASDKKSPATLKAGQRKAPVPQRSQTTAPRGTVRQTGNETDTEQAVGAGSLAAGQSAAVLVDEVLGEENVVVAEEGVEREEEAGDEGDESVKQRKAGTGTEKETTVRGRREAPVKGKKGEQPADDDGVQLWAEEQLAEEPDTASRRAARQPAPRFAPMTGRGQGIRTRSAARPGTQQLGVPSQRQQNALSTGGVASTGYTSYQLDQLLSIMSSLRSLSTVSSSADSRKGDRTVLLFEMQDKLQKAKSKADLESLEARFQEQKTHLQRREAKQDEIEKKMEEARAEAQKAKILNWVLGIFGAIISSLSIFLGAAFIVTGAGAALGALMIAGGVAGLIGATDGLMKLGTERGVGIAGSIALATGSDIAGARNADKIFGITLLVATVVVAVGSLVVGMAQAFGKIATQAVNLLLARLLIRIGMTVQGVMTSASGAMGMGASIHQGEAMFRSSDAKSLQAEDRALAAYQGIIDKHVDILIEQIADMDKRNADELKSIMDALEVKQSALIHAKI